MMSRNTRSWNTRRLGVRLVIAAVALAIVPGGVPPASAAGIGHAPGAASARASSAAGSPARRAHRHRYLHAASFNISGVLNDGTGRSHRSWQVRRKYVARELLGQSPVAQRSARADVIALQEANTSSRLRGGRTQYADLVHQLNHWTRGSNPYRAVKPGLHLNATRIAYNAHTLHLTKAGAFRWKAQELKADGARMMAWARFRLRSTGKRFFFASVHLETASRNLRLRQWQQLVHVVPRLAHGLPVVLGGDFNATRNHRHDTARQMLPVMRHAGFGDALGQSGPGYLPVAKTRPGHVVNARYGSLNHYRRHLAHYGSHAWVGQDVDYLFASNRLRIMDWGMVADHRKGSDTLRGVIPSDHNMIRATVALR
ncbi:MAG: endonuclease/exonuclease/phosphatase family protein [Marmoricola sp.]